MMNNTKFKVIIILILIALITFKVFSIVMIK
jgi:hypothetical protein